jgi:hypothetical protein
MRRREVQRRRTIVSVDLDSVACYHAIHGLPDPSPSSGDVIYSHCLPRFLELFAQLGVRATFFVVGRDVENSNIAADVLRRALEQGHELGNHSYSHAYDLSRWSLEGMHDDLSRCDRILRGLGADVCGFRAPGYVHHDALLEQVRKLGYLYDSSLLPSLTYYAAKSIVLAKMALRRRVSQAIWTGPRTFMGYRQPWFDDNVGLWRFPISATPRLQLPLIGTSLLAAPKLVQHSLARSAARLGYFHFELHGIDLADPRSDPFDPRLCERQPELKVSLARKRERLGRLLEQRGSTTRMMDLAQQ